MSELGDLLELMYTATRRYTTLRATIREWRHLERTERAFQRYAETLDAPGGSGAVVMIGFGFGAEQPPEETEALIGIWLAPPGKIRMERSGEGEAQTTVSDGAQEWTYAPSLGAYFNPAGSTYHGFEHMTDPSLLLGQLDLEPVGSTSVAGRAAIVVRAGRRGREWHGPAGLPEGADRHELAVDAERGTLLRAASFLDGEEFVTEEMLEISFDEPLPDDTFVFTPPPGEEIRDADSAFPPVQIVTVEEAGRLAAFTVLVPRRLPEGATMEHAVFNPGFERTAAPPSVNLAYRFEEAGHSLSIGQTGEPQPVGDGGWEKIDRDGLTLRYLDRFGQRLLACERFGTHVMLISDLDRETLIEIALSLEPAPTEPPRLVDA